MKSCIVAPIHEPKFAQYGIPFITSYNKHFDDDNIFLIFSNEKEKTIFENMTEGLKYQSIVCTEPLNYSKPITQKKVFGTRWIFKNTNFEYVGIIDADCEFIANKDYDTLFQQHFAKNRLIASHVNNKGMVDKVGRYTAEKFFNSNDVHKLKTLTEDFKVFFWFNEIPVYEKNSFLEFLKYIDYDNIIPKLEYVTFDFVMYVFYLMVMDKIRLEIIDVPIQDKGSFLEAQDYFKPELFAKIFHTYNPMWIKNPIPDMKNVFIKMHTDRK